jgi:hypothetical protein
LNVRSADKTIAYAINFYFCWYFGELDSEQGSLEILKLAILHLKAQEEFYDIGFSTFFNAARQSQQFSGILEIFRNFYNFEGLGVFRNFENCQEFLGIFMSVENFLIFSGC